MREGEKEKFTKLNARIKQNDKKFHRCNQPTVASHVDDIDLTSLPNTINLTYV